MKFALQFGDIETHLLEYEFNQLLGSLVIKVNHKPIKQAVRWFNEPVKEVHELVVGDMERASVRIEKERGQLFGQRNRVYVNNRLQGVYHGV